MNQNQELSISGINCLVLTMFLFARPFLTIIKTNSKLRNNFENYHSSLFEVVRTKPPNKRKRYPSILIRVFPRKPHRPTSGGCGAGGRSELNCYLRPQWSDGTLSSRKKDVLVERRIFLAILGAVFHSFF